MADRSDSNEMLHTPDAAEITQTGRAYLQVGNNEVYELFQSAWSGADYQPDKDDMGIEDHTIYLINELGQYEILNEDLSGLEEAEEIKEVPTELDAIVQHIQVLCQEQEIPPVPQPWLPPLKERIALEELEEVHPTVAWTQEKPLSVLLGMADIPQAQKQEAVSINLSKDGHILLYGSPGTGKTTFLQTAAMDLARKFSPKDLTMYLMDFGTNGLAPLSKLPQVADTMLLDQAEKISKFVRIMERELNRRKKLLADYGVGTLELYREASGQQEPSIVILLDSYEAIKEEAYEAELFKLLVRISREGLSIGVHLLMTAGRQSNLRAQLYSNFKHQLSLPQNDASEVRAIVGSTLLAMTMEDIKGRALMKREEVDVIQLALPVSGANDTQVLNNLRQEVASLQEAWTGQRSSAIPMVPEELTFDTFVKTASVKAALKANNLPLGLDFVNVESVNIPLIGFKHMLYISNEAEHLKNITRHLLEIFTNLIPSKKVMFMDIDNEYEGQFNLFARISKPETLSDMANQLLLELEDRKKGESGHDFVIFIPDLEKFVEVSGLTGEQVSVLYQEGWKYNMHFVVGSLYSYINNNAIGTPARQIKTYNQYYLLGMRLADQMILDKPYNSKEPYLNKDELYLYGHQSSVKVKITK